MAAVELRGLAKVYEGGVEGLAATDLAVGSGELFVIVGPSGSGKSTLLRLIAGLEEPTAGTLWIGGTRADHLAPRDRDLALVFQQPTVYPHLSVAENLGFGLRARGRPRAEVAERVAAVAAQFGLGAVLERFPRALSGGERQRVALGRAIARRPRVLLCDEPFSSLDAPLRAALRAVLLDLHRALGMTLIHVTHDQAEALALGDRLAVLERGRIAQVGTPQEVYDRPATRFVAGFLGSPPMNLLRCDWRRDAATIRVRPAGGSWEASWTLAETSSTSFPTGTEGTIELGLRPEQVRPDEGSAVVGEVRRVESLGHERIVAVAVGRQTLHLRLPARSRDEVGDRVPLGFDPGEALWFDPQTGNRVSSVGHRPAS